MAEVGRAQRTMFLARYLQREIGEDLNVVELGPDPLPGKRWAARSARHALLAVIKFGGVFRRRHALTRSGSASRVPRSCRPPRRSCFGVRPRDQE
jgi:hypothetical protein